MPNHTNLEKDKTELASLMKDFPVEGGVLDVADALEELYARYKALGVSEFAGITGLIPDDQFSLFFNELVISVHGLLFQNILCNAGQFRSSLEVNQGRVYFGSNKKFTGYLPSDIETGVLKSCQYLKKTTGSPQRDAILFYQHFVCVHPFYDANGRIGRFLVDVYLYLHGYRMSWRGLRKNDKWLKKLNECHKRVGTHTFDQYFDYLYNYFEPFISELREE